MIETLAHGFSSGGVTSVPRLAAVARHVDQPVVGAGPDAIDVERRRRDRVDHAALRRLAPRACPCRLPTFGGTSHVFARQVGADLRPAVAAGRRLPQRVRREVQRVRIDRREEHRQRADDAVVAAAAADARRDLHDLAGAAVVARDLAAVDDVGIERIGRDVAVLLDADRDASRGT